jgi:hypothetical protein
MQKDHNIGFEGKRLFFRRKLGKIGKQLFHCNIDSVLAGFRLSARTFGLPCRTFTNWRQVCFLESLHFNLRSKNIYMPTHYKSIRKLWQAGWPDWAIFRILFILADFKSNWSSPNYVGSTFSRMQNWLTSTECSCALRNMSHCWRCFVVIVSA